MNNDSNDFIVTENAMRPASTKRECFYCQRPIGSPHREECVTICKRVMIRSSFVYSVVVPASWSKDDVEHARNYGSWCANNALREINERINDDECLCNSASFEFLKDTAEAAFLSEVGEPPAGAAEHHRKITLDDLNEVQITACRGLLVYHLGGSQRKWSIGEHNEAGGYGIPLTDDEKLITNAHKNFVIGKILEICQARADQAAQIESLTRERDEARRICGRFGVVEWGLMAPPVPNEVETRRAELDAAIGALKSVRDCPTTMCGSCKAILYAALKQDTARARPGTAETR